jgi:hypothetical protein
VSLLGNRPSSGVVAGMAVLLVAGAVVVAGAVGSSGHTGPGRETSNVSPRASSTPPVSRSPGGGAAQPSGTAPPSSASASPPPTAAATPSPATSAATSASATAAPPPACTAGDLLLSTATDQPTYQIGAAVRITTTMRNASGHTCTTDGQTGCGPNFTVFDSAGSAIWTSTAPGAVRSCPAAYAAALGPGQSVSFSASWDQCTWQNQKCTGQVQRGAYSAAGVWTEGTAKAAGFSIA